MKLGKKKYFFLNAILVILIVFFISTFTVSYLYKKSSISKEDYFSLLLSDTYGDDFYIKLVEIINNNFNPLKVIEMPIVEKNNFSISNKLDINNPYVYIYNQNINQEYKEEYNVNPNVLLTSYFLSENLNNLGINTIFEDSDINEFSNNNNINIKDTINIYINDKINNYKSIKYIFNIGRIVETKRNTTISINNKNYALISLYTNKNNISLITKLNSKLNEKYNGISKIFFDDTYNGSINIDFGGNENTMKEVLNSIKVFSKTFKEVIF